MDLDPTWLFVSLLTISAGLVLFLYGKKQSRIPHMAIGLVMMGYVYFVPSVVAVVAIGGILAGFLWLLVHLGY
ncbi:MAG: hypothetical protein HY716_07065 [Planctomycetes bacterium]|nr:hypothetical protein [Planctomycetota bacterium]